MMEPAKSKSVDTAAEKTAKSPMCKPRVTLNRCPNANGENNDGEIFSPTSAAALALSTLHHFGADRDSRPSTGSLKGTRLFNKSGDTPVTESVGEHKTKDDSITNEARNSTEPDQAATFAPVCNVNAHHPGALPAVYSYPALSPSIGAAPHYPPPPPHHHHHHPYPSPYSHDPRFAPWSQAPLAPPKSRVGNSSGSKAPPTAMPWHGPSFACPHPPPPGGNYSVDVRPGSRGSTPTLIGPSPPSSRSGSAGPEVSYYHPGHLPPRSSPVSFAGPSPHAGRGSENPNPPSIQDKTNARAQSEMPLVTPTPKKAKLSQRGSNPSIGSVSSTNSNNSNGYSRKKKSLGVLADNFLKAYQTLPRGATIIVDEAAVKLAVERRRIYDVVNILEAICLVSKKHKNTYTWMGLEHLDVVFGRLQAAAIEDYPQDALRFLGASEVNSQLKEAPVGRKTLSQDRGREFKSLAKLSQEFLQVFLVGHQTLSLPEASDKIQGTTTVEELVAMGQKRCSEDTNERDEKQLKAAAARGLKTKIRRLYDIANVFLSVGFLRKVDSNDSTRRPNFTWTYRLTPTEIYNLHRPSTSNSSSNKKNDKEDEENDKIPEDVNRACAIKSQERNGSLSNNKEVPPVTVSASSSPCAASSSSANAIKAEGRFV